MINHSLQQPDEKARRVRNWNHIFITLIVTHETPPLKSVMLYDKRKRINTGAGRVCHFLQKAMIRRLKMESHWETKSQFTWSVDLKLEQTIRTKLLLMV